MSRRHRLAFAAVITGLLAVAPGVAMAAWNSVGAGKGYVRADALPTGAKPTVAVSGRNVTVSWAVSKFANGTNVNGYTVKRYDTSNVAQTIGAACSGTINALTCTEAAVPTGTWTYSITPKQGAWTGTEGAKSSNAVVGAASLTLTPTTVTSLPSTLTGSIANYITGQTVTWRLDNSTSGTLLTGSITPSTVPASGGASASVTIPTGTTLGAHTVYAIGSSGDVVGQAITVSDTTAPTVSAAVIGKTAGGVTGFVKQAGTYYVYANITDPAPASGVASATANVTNITTGSTAVALTAGSYTANGVSYSYRSASLTATNPLTAGSKTFTVTATDVAGNGGTTSGFSVTVDNTAPAASDVQTTNVAAGTNGKAETGDTISLTYTEPIDANSIQAGWDGTSTAVTLRLVQNGAGDRVQIFNAANTTALPLGTVVLGRTDYTTATVSFTNSTMVQSGNTITVTLGTPSGATTTAAATGSMTWTPSATATDRAGNACSTTAVTETGAADKDF